MKIPSPLPILKIILGHKFIEGFGVVESQKIMQTNTKTRRMMTVATILVPYAEEYIRDFDNVNRHYNCIVTLQNAISESVDGTYYSYVR